ncbi:MAG: hypothetical protein ABSG94_06640 [Brevinematales bacterium]|jgi:hypothetical protein
MANETYESLKGQIERSKSFTMKFFIADKDVEKEVGNILRIIFEKFHKADYVGVLVTCLMELIVNAAKANLKRVIFEVNRLNIDDENVYLTSMLKFKNLLVEASYIKYFNELKDHDYWIKVFFEYDENGIKIEVVNNVHLTNIEDRRIREKLSKAMKYQSIAQFYLDQGDELEGAGMGLALVVMLLKGLGIPPELFRVGNINGNETMLRMEIPLCDKYTSVRYLTQ